jgi:hypothetical protein
MFFIADNSLSWLTVHSISELPEGRQIASRDEIK